MAMLYFLVSTHAGWPDGGKDAAGKPTLARHDYVEGTVADVPEPQAADLIKKKLARVATPADRWRDEEPGPEVVADTLTEQTVAPAGPRARSLRGAMTT